MSGKFSILDYEQRKENLYNISDRGGSYFPYNYYLVIKYGANRFD